MRRRSPRLVRSRDRLGFPSMRTGKGCEGSWSSAVPVIDCITVWRYSIRNRRPRKPLIGAGARSWQRGGLVAPTTQGHPMKYAMKNALAAILVLTMAEAGAAPLQTITVAATASDQTYQAEGIVEAVRQSSIAAQVPARIVEMRVRAGDTVKGGQVLARLD